MDYQQTATLEHLFTDERVRVTRWTFQTGQATGMHVHEVDYIAIPITGGEFVVEMGDGSTIEMTQIAGSPYARQAGVHHNVQFVGSGTAQFVEVEHLT